MVAGTKSSKGRPGAAGGEAMEVSPGPSPAGLRLGSQGPPGNAHSTGRLGCLQGQKAQGTFGEGAFARGRLGADSPRRRPEGHALGPQWRLFWAWVCRNSGRRQQWRPGPLAPPPASSFAAEPGHPGERTHRAAPRVARAFTAGVAVETPLTAGPTCPGNAPPKSGRSPAVSGS